MSLRVPPPLVLVVMAAFALPLAAAEQPWLVRTWQTDDGLPNNDVTCLAQALDGAMLFATRGGLARFDGLRFRELEIEAPGAGSGVSAVLPARDGSLWVDTRGVIVHQHAPKPDHVLKMPALDVGGSRETAFFEDASGVLWLCFEGGRFHRIDGDRVQQVPVADGLSATFASCAALDAKGTVWASGPRVLARWTGDRFTSVAELPKDRCMITRASDGGLWIGAGRKLLRFTEDAGLAEIGEITGAPTGSRISSMLEDRSGRLWLGTFGAGLWLRTSEGFQSVTLPNADVWWLSEDREGSVWAATGGGGVCRVRPRVLTLLDEPGSPRGEVARALCLDARGDLWVAVQNGAKLMVRRGGHWLDLAPGQDWPAKKANRVASGPSGAVWIGTGDGDLVRWDGRAFESIAMPTDQANLPIMAIFETNDGDVWVGRGFKVWRRRAGVWGEVAMPAESGEAQTFAQDASGQLWAGTVRGFLLREEKGRFVREAAEALGPKCSSVRALLPMPDGSLLIGTQGVGIARLAAGQGRIISREHGLPHKVISQLALDLQGRVWAGSDAGIFMVPYAQLVAVAEGKAASVHATSFGRSEGVSGLQANTSFPGALVRPDGQLWMATRIGIALLETNRVGQNTIPPQPSIEMMTVNDGESMPLWKVFGALPQETEHTVAGTVATLPPGVENLAFEFGASSYTAPENVRIRYQLAGIDLEPRFAAADRRAVYGRIPPGEYTLSVSAANNDGVWSTRDAVLAFTVQPFYWQTAWFRILASGAALAAAALAAHFASERRALRRAEALRREAAVERERTRIARDIHDELGASLTQISLLAELAGDGRPDENLSRLHTTAREAVSALDVIVWAVNPRHDSLPSLLAYLGQQAVDFLQAAGIRCRLDFPPSIPPRHLPADFRHHLFLIVREAINNAAKYAAAQEVRLSAELSDTELRISIADDGRGFDPAAAAGDGLRNLRERAAALGGECVIASEIGIGTTITLRLPWPAPSADEPLVKRAP